MVVVHKNTRIRGNAKTGKHFVDPLVMDHVQLSFLIALELCLIWLPSQMSR